MHHGPSQRVARAARHTHVWHARAGKRADAGRPGRCGGRAGNFLYTLRMAQDPTSTYRKPHEASASPPGVDGPREVLGRISIPVIGDVDAELGLGRSLHLEIDRSEAVIRPGSGLVLRAPELPTVELRELHVDLVQGVVRSDADALGAFFDRVLTVALCSALRQTLSWKPGSSLAELAARRLPRGSRGGRLPVWARHAFPRTSVGVHPETRLALDLRGDALELSLSRPAFLRVLGLGLKVVMVRYVFGAARFEVKAAGVGPLRRAVLAFAAWLASRWVRARLPAAMTVPGYDLFADESRGNHVQDLVRRLRGHDEHRPEDMGAGAGKHPHELARAGEGRRAGLGGMFSATKAAVFAAIQTVRLSADDMPAVTRSLVKLPLGPFSAVAICTDRGGDLAIVKHPGGLRLEAPLGIYLFTDQFPELAELRLTRVVLGLGDEGTSFDLQTEPPLGPLLRALLHRLTGEHLIPRLPHDRLRAGGVLQTADAEHHVLWRHGLGDRRTMIVRTSAGAEVSLHHTEEALVLSAPAGLEVVFDGLPLPPARIERLAYHWQDGTIDADEGAGLGEFGNTLAGQLLRVRAAPHAPRGLGLHAAGGPGLDAAQERQFSATLLSIPVPLLGHIALRFDPQDTLGLDAGPDLLSMTSERGVLLVIPELKASLLIRGARYVLPRRALELDATPAPGPYVLALAGLCIEAFLMPLLRKALPLWPDAEATAPWAMAQVLRTKLAERLGYAADLSLAPGAFLTIRRTPDTLILGATEPVQVSGDGFLGELGVAAIRWLPGDGRIELLTQPAPGPLALDLARRLHARFTPDFLARGLAERLALPARVSEPPPLPPAPNRPALIELPLPLLGSLSLTVDRSHATTLSLRRDQLAARLGDGAVLHAEELGVHFNVRGADITFLPFTVELDSDPQAGELEDHLVTHALRGVFARFLTLFWPSHRSPRDGHDILLSLGRDQPWGPLDLCVAHGGAIELQLDPDGIGLRSDAGVFIAGEAVGWLPNFNVHSVRYRFNDGAVRMRISGVEERYYHEAASVSPFTEDLVAHLLRVLVIPHMPTWTQRLGLRILPPPAMPPVDPTHIAVWRAQLPGGYAQVNAMMDPTDTLTIRASREEFIFISERGLQIDVPGLHLRIPLQRARYHMQSGEVQVDELGQLENALAEAIMRHQLTVIDPTAADPGTTSLTDVLDRFPVEDDGRRVLFHDKLVRIMLDPETAFLAEVIPEGLRITVDPPLKIDGVAGFDFVFAGLRFDFADAKFHLDIQRDGLLAGVFSRLINKEAEALLESILLPLLPKAMRTPGYSLATDPNPSATLAALVRTLSLGKLGKLTAQ